VFDELAGVWELESYAMRDEDGHEVAPFGKQPVGLLVITADGWMSAHMAAGATDRPDFGSAQTLGGAEQQAAAFRTYAGYAGRWRVEGKRLITTVAVTVHPNWLGTEQVREFELTGGRLRLRAAVVRMTADMMWRRVA
jgi:hypothetical protein